MFPVLFGAKKSAPWTPSRLPGFVISLNPALSLAQGKLWQDAAKTTPATANNDPVRVATCPYSGLDLTAPSDAARPLLTSEGSGKWSLTFDGTDDTLRRTFTGGAASPYAVGVGLLRSAASAYAMVFVSRDSFREMRFFANGTQVESLIDNGSATIIDPTALTINTFATFIMNTDGAANLYRNGSSVATDAVDSTSSAANTISVGSRAGGSLFLAGRISCLVYTEGTLNAGNVALLNTFITGTY